MALTRHAGRLGVGIPDIASLVGLASETVHDWRASWRDGFLNVAVRGRPARVSAPAERNAVIGALTLLGPETPALALGDLFPWMARRERDDIARRFRRVARRKGELRFELEWLKPGAVWAIDATQPPGLVDGIYRSILAVRDLASGVQLLALPCKSNDEETVLGALRTLFLEHGAPLILKSDNGSSFCSERVRDLLAQVGVVLLLSPPALPRYNGACEAGIGVLKTRAHHEAVRHGRSGEWTSDDLEGARLLGNRLPQGGTSPEERWSTREEVRADDRATLRDEVETQRRASRKRHPDASAAAVERLAIAAAACNCKLLEVRRRRITPRIESLRREKIA